VIEVVGLLVDAVDLLLADFAQPVVVIVLLALDDQFAVVRSSSKDTRVSRSLGSS
jgi:hypothetical protein